MCGKGGGGSSQVIAKASLLPFPAAWQAESHHPPATPPQHTEARQHSKPRCQASLPVGSSAVRLLHSILFLPGQVASLPRPAYTCIYPPHAESKSRGGQIYYFNPETGESVWEKPTAPAGGGSGQVWCGEKDGESGERETFNLAYPPSACTLKIKVPSYVTTIYISILDTSCLHLNLPSLFPPSFVRPRSTSSTS